jgi:hypothetical protein
MTRNMTRALEFVDIFDEQGRITCDNRPVPIYKIIPKNETQTDPETNLRYSTKVLAIMREHIDADHLLTLMYAHMRSVRNQFGDFISGSSKRQDPTTYCKHISRQNVLTRDTKVMRLSGIPPGVHAQDSPSKLHHIGTPSKRLCYTRSINRGAKPHPTTMQFEHLLPGPRSPYSEIDAFLVALVVFHHRGFHMVCF